MNESTTAAEPQSVTWDEFDQVAVCAMADPHGMLHRLRDACPVGRTDKWGGVWTVVGHPEVSVAARDVATFRSREPGPGFPVFGSSMPLIGDDPPVHRALRGPLQKRFSPRAAEAMREDMREVVTDLIDGFIGRGSADLAAELCIPLPAAVASDMLDLPRENRTQLSEWSMRIVAEGAESDVFGLLAAFVDDLYVQRSAHPGEDVASLALGFEIEGRPITREEWDGLVMVLILAGLDTTSNGGALMLHDIATRPGLKAALLEDPARIPAAVEELLRLTSPVPQHARGVAQDTELGGQRLAAGDRVVLHWMAANRDPRVFEDPDELVLDRVPNQHYAFGYGPHRCLGSHLARVELQVLVEEVLRRLPDYEVVPSAVVRYPGLNRGMSGLGVRFSPGAREGTA